MVCTWRGPELKPFGIVAIWMTASLALEACASLAAKLRLRPRDFIRFNPLEKLLDPSPPLAVGSSSGWTDRDLFEEPLFEDNPPALLVQV